MMDDVWFDEDEIPIRKDETKTLHKYIDYILKIKREDEVRE